MARPRALPLHLLVPPSARALIFLVAPAAASSFLYLSLTPAQLACAGTFVAAVALAVGLTLLHVRAHGILAWLPVGVRTLLLETTILEFSLDDSFVGTAKKFVPLFAGPTVGELRELLASYSPRAQRILLQPGGLGKLFPTSLQKWLHPSLELEEDDVVARLTALSECRGVGGENAVQSDQSAVKVSDLVNAASSTVASRRNFGKVKASDLVAAATQRQGNDTPPTTGDILMGQMRASFSKNVRQVLNARRIRRVGSIAFCLLLLLLSSSKSLRKMSSQIFRFALAGALGSVSMFAAVGTLLLNRGAGSSTNACKKNRPSDQTSSAGATATTSSAETDASALPRGFSAAKRLVLLLKHVKQSVDRRESEGRRETG